MFFNISLFFVKKYCNFRTNGKSNFISNFVNDSERNCSFYWRSCTKKRGERGGGGGRGRERGGERGGGKLLQSAGKDKSLVNQTTRKFVALLKNFQYFRIYGKVQVLNRRGSIS